MSQGANLPAREPETLPWTVAGVVLVSFATLFFTSHYWLGLPVIAAAVLASYATTFRFPRWRIARWGLRAALLGAILLIVGIPKDRGDMWYFIPEYTNLVGYLIAAEVLVRAWVMPAPGLLRQSRAVVLTLCGLIMMMASNTYDRGPVHALAPAFVLLCALAFRQIGRAEAAGRATGVEPRARRPLGPAVLRWAALALALAMGFTWVFALTKYENKVTTWAMKFLRQQRRPPAAAIGLTGSPRLRRVFNPAQSPTRVLRLEGTPSERHVRLLAFDTFQFTEWRPSIGGRTFTPVEPKDVQADLSGPRVRITRFSDTFEVLPVPVDATAVEAPGVLGRDDLAVLRGVEAGANDTFEVTTGKGRDPAVVAIAPALAEAQRAGLLSPGPGVNAQVIELAKQVAGDAPDPARRVFRIQQYLRANHGYSLSFDPAPGDPLADFLLNKRSAHCQYFATATVIMARVAGVPARLATGYYAHERVAGDEMVVRERDAHAWAECWIDGTGWVTVDSTPAGGRPDQLFPEPSKWRQRWERLADLPGRVRDWLMRLPAGPVIAGAVAVAVLGTGVWLGRLAWKRRGLRRGKDEAYAAPPPELAEAARRFDRLLQRRGLACPPNRTWREHLRALDGQAPVDPQACDRFIEDYDRARFGNANGETVQRLRRALEVLEGEGRRG